jgi:hypothetical protein
MTALGQSEIDRAATVELSSEDLGADPWWSSVFDETDADETPSVQPQSRLGGAKWVLRPVVIYLASRLITLLTMLVGGAFAHRTVSSQINVWDSKWFIRAAGLGYPSRLPMIHGHVAASPIAFFPAFPLTFKWLSELTGMSLLISGAIVSGVTGLTAMIAVWMLVRDYAGSRAADRSTLLLALFPASFVFSLVYAEGMIITLVAVSLLALLHRRWFVAGVAAALATATAPIALALVVSCAWVALRAIMKDRTWSALAAPLLAPVGFIAYQVWLWRHTGDIWAWRQTELGGWHSYLSVAYPVHVVTSFFATPFGTTASIRIVFVSIVVTVVFAVVALRGRLPIPLLLYGLSVAVVAILTRPIGPRPRFLMVAFPLIVAVATRLRGKPYIAVVSLSTVLLIGLTAYSVLSNSVFP